jgi:hypothetical protein
MGQLGQDIIGTTNHYRVGYSVSMNNIGDKIAIGAIGSTNVVGTYKRGYTTIHKLEITNINGEGTTYNSGFSVSMNDLGDRVAVGAINNNGNGIKSGYVRVFQFTE